MKFRRPENCPLCNPLSWVVILGAAIVGLFMWIQTGAGAKAYAKDFLPRAESLKDGRYEGAFELLGMVSAATVAFEIDSGRVTEVQVKKLLHTPGYASVRAIRSRLEEEKNLQFDAVSGATISSDFLRAAIRTAIENGPSDKIPE